MVQSEVSHIWPGVRTLQGTHNAARRVLDGVQVLSNTVSSLSGSTGSTAVVGQTTKTLSGWMADQVSSNSKPYRRALNQDTIIFTTEHNGFCDYGLSGQSGFSDLDGPPSVHK